MSDEAKEIERLAIATHGRCDCGCHRDSFLHWCKPCAILTPAIELVYLARRLLEERDEAVESANALAQIGQKYLAQLHDADKHAEALCELVRVALMKKYGEHIASLERELEDTKLDNVPSRSQR